MVAGAEKNSPVLIKIRLPIWINTGVGALAGPLCAPQSPHLGILAGTRMNLTSHPRAGQRCFRFEFAFLLYNRYKGVNKPSVT
jgi:hypothetical protein